MHNFPPILTYLQFGVGDVDGIFMGVVGLKCYPQPSLFTEVLPLVVRSVSDALL